MLSEFLYIYMMFICVYSHKRNTYILVVNCEHSSSFQKFAVANLYDLLIGALA